MIVFRPEVKVGLLILVAFILLSAGIFVTSDLIGSFEKKKTLVLLFPYADGITEGSPVWYAGLEVGEVSTLEIARDGSDRIAVTVQIDPKARVRRDSRVDIRSLGMMGAKYVEISPGSHEAPEVGEGESFEGRSPTSLSQVIETGQEVASRLSDLVQETQGLVREVRGEGSIQEVVRNANAFLVEMRAQGEALKTLMVKLNTFAATLNDSGENIKKATGEGGKEMVALVKDLRETNRGLQKRLENVEGRLTKTLSEIDKGFAEAGGAAADLRSIVASGQLEISALLAHLKEASRHMEALSEDLRAHPYKIIWKEKGTRDEVTPAGSEEWREKGRVGPFGKK